MLLGTIRPGIVGNGAEIVARGAGIHVVCGIQHVMSFPLESHLQAPPSHEPPLARAMGHVPREGIMATLAQSLRQIHRSHMYA